MGAGSNLNDIKDALQNEKDVSSSPFTFLLRDLLISISVSIPLW